MFTKTVMKPVEVVDTDVLKPGTKIYFKWFHPLFADEDPYDEGFGEVTHSNEFGIDIEYQGRHDLMESSFHLSLIDLNSRVFAIELC